MKYHVCPECGTAEPDLLDEETYQAWLGWEMTSSSVKTTEVTFDFRDSQS